MLHSIKSTSQRPRVYRFGDWNNELWFIHTKKICQERHSVISPLIRPVHFSLTKHSWETREKSVLRGIQFLKIGRTFTSISFRASCTYKIDFNEHLNQDSLDTWDVCLLHQKSVNIVLELIFGPKVHWWIAPNFISIILSDGITQGYNFKQLSLLGNWICL